MQAERTEAVNDGVFRRTARKEHRCTGCRRTIAVGESHIEDLNMARGAYVSGPRYCDGCALDAGLLVRISGRPFRWWVVSWSYHEGSSRPWRQESHEGSVDADSLGAALDGIVTGGADDSIPWDLINQDREVTISIRPVDDDALATLSCSTSPRCVRSPRSS